MTRTKQVLLLALALGLLVGGIVGKATINGFSWREGLLVAAGYVVLLVVVGAVLEWVSPSDQGEDSTSGRVTG